MKILGRVLVVLLFLSFIWMMYAARILGMF